MHYASIYLSTLQCFLYFQTEYSLTFFESLEVAFFLLFTTLR